MGLLSLFSRRDDPGASGAQVPEAVVAARVSARRRLIGASVLLAIGVLGFPLLFETQPRPIPVDIPIEIPRKEVAAPLVLPPTRPAPPAAAVVPLDAPAPATSIKSPEPTAESAPPATAVAPSRPPASTSRAADDGLRAQALLDGKPLPPTKASEAGAMRVVVQVGAYTDAEKVRAARQKVEQLGMKTYTQVVDADGATRTRVRVGPFASRQEAEQAAARLKGAGLPAAILVL